MNNLSNLTSQELCSMFDHTLLKPFADYTMFEQLCQEAVKYHFAMVAVNSFPVSLCKKLLKGSDVHVGAAISFPLGQTTIPVKVYETQQAIYDGADEIDYVINIGELKNGNLDYIRREMDAIVSCCREKGVLSKVIIENCYLTHEEIVSVATIAKDIRPDFIKTSTGFGISGATAEDVRLMKKSVGQHVKVKAAGGIRSWNDCQAMIQAGAERIGTSSSLKILKEFEAIK